MCYAVCIQRGGESQSSAADVWSATCNIVLMITGQHPWEGVDSNDVPRKVCVECGIYIFWDTMNIVESRFDLSVIVMWCKFLWKLQDVSTPKGPSSVADTKGNQYSFQCFRFVSAISMCV